MLSRKPCSFRADELCWSLVILSASFQYFHVSIVILQKGYALWILRKLLFFTRFSHNRKRTANPSKSLVQFVFIISRCQKVGPPWTSCFWSSGSEFALCFFAHEESSPLAAVFTLSRVRKSGNAALGLIQCDLMLAPWRRNVPQKKRKNIAGSAEVSPKGKKAQQCEAVQWSTSTTLAKQPVEYYNVVRTAGSAPRSVQGREPQNARNNIVCTPRRRTIREPAGCTATCGAGSTACQLPLPNRGEVA